MSATTIEMPDVSEIEKEKTDIVTQAHSFVILDDDSYQKACVLGRELATFEKRIVEHYASSKELSDKAHKAICAAEKTQLDPVKRAKDFLREIVAKWMLSEKLRIKAEQDKILKEAQDKADEESRLARQKQEDDRLQMASDLEARGDRELAEQVLEAPIYVAPPVAKVSYMAPQMMKAKGVSGRKKFKFEVIDTKILPRDFMSQDDKKIRDYINFKQDEAAIPGVRIWEDVSVSFKAG